MPDPIRYSDAVETPHPDEQETIAAIIRAMTGEAHDVARTKGHVPRPSHLESTGLLRMERPPD